MKHLKLFFALFAMLALGVGNAWGAGTWTLVKDASTLAAGDKVIIVAKDKDFAMSTTQNTNNRGQVAVTKDGETLTYTTAVQELTLKDGKTSGTLAFYTGSGYLYAASSSKNYLKTETTLSANSSWTITIANTGAATIKATGSNSRNWLRYNATNNPPIFSCYRSGQSDICLYKYVEEQGGDEGGEEPVASLVSIAANAEGKNEFTVGDEFVKAIITATYDDETTKDVTSLATFTGYNMNTTGTQTVNVEYEGKTTSYTITVNPKPTYTITWNNAGTTNETKVVQGAALGELPTVSDCPNGKKFMGWTAATSVNNDGSGVTYIKSTDKPTANTTYYAVFAVVEGDAGTPTTATVSISDYAIEKNWVNSKQYGTVNIDANITATATGGGNTGKYYTSGTNWRLYQNENPSLTISAAEGFEIQMVKVTYTNSNDGILTLDGSNVASGTACEVNAASVTFGVGNTGTATNGQVRITEIEVTYAPAAKKSDYSLNCDIHQDPYLTVLKTAIDFGTVAQNETVTETLSVSGGYLAEAVALTISGTDASFFSVNPTTIAKADELDQDVIITYNPTATGEHTATLTIKTGDITKIVSLSGTVLAPGKWVLVKNVTELSAGDEVIIASSISNYAIGTAASSNYKGAAITKVGETANATADVTIITVEETGVANAPYAFKTDGKYLYAASSSANQLKAQATNNENGQWAVTITAEGIASVEAANSSNRKVMQCNPNGGSPIFACYASASSSYEPLAIYRNSQNVVKPVIFGKADFVGSTQVTITAQSGLTVYYTTDGSDPDNTSTQYTEPFTINATTTVKAIAYDASSNASGVAEMTFTKHDLVNVETAMALDSGKTAYLSQFEVVYPLKDKSFIYIKDNSGYGLIYDGTLDEQFKAGDRVEGFIGTSSPYKSLPELKAVNKHEDLTITPGVAAEPIEFAAEPTVADVNKYVVFKNVQFDAAVTFETTKATNTTFTIDSETVTLRNNYKYAASLDANKAYDVYGFVATFQQNEGDPVQVQVYFLTAVEAGGVIETYTVTYDANGATGAAPVDETKYQAGQTFYIENQGELVKEGYEFVGWKYNGTIYEAGKQFTMPAESVTFVAQWEEIVVTPKKDFSEGYWVLVTEASELNADDYIVIAAAEEDLAMKSYERGNNCGQIEITKSANLLIWNENVGVFQLLASGSNYTIQDVNTKQYLYAAGTGTSNHLKATDEIPADEGMAKYVWTISFTGGVPTVKATSENRNTLMYNAGSDLFSCYSSGQKAIALYKYVTELPTIELNSDDNSTVITANAGKTVNVKLNRSFTAGDGYYTLCVPFDIAASEIGTAYKLGTITKHVSGDEGGININLTSVSTIEAGVPYLVLPNTLTNPVFENVIIVNTTGSDYTITGAGVNVTFTGIINGVGETTNNSTEYYVGDKGYLYNGTVEKLGLRAFFTITDEAGNKVNVRARVVAGENVETGVEDIITTDAPVKVIVNGQLIIIRDGVKYNVQGQKL